MLELDLGAADCEFKLIAIGEVGFWRFWVQKNMAIRNIITPA